MSPIEAVTSVYRNYFNFGGRSPRSEFDWYALFWWGAIYALYLLSLALGTEEIPYALLGLLWLGSIIPFIAVAARRMHDTGNTAWLLLLILLPLGNVLLLLYLLIKGSDGPNKWGEPRGSTTG